MNRISRTIAPYVDAQSPVAGDDRTSGLGDILQELLLFSERADRRRMDWARGPSVASDCEQRCPRLREVGCGADVVVLR